MYLFARHSVNPFLPIIIIWGTAIQALNLSSSIIVPNSDGETTIRVDEANVFDPNLYDCPQACSDYVNINAWTPYQSAARLRRCREPMLLQFSIESKLDDPLASVFIRACSINQYESNPSNFTTSVDKQQPVKASSEASAKTSSACVVATGNDTVLLQIDKRHEKGEFSNEVNGLLEGMQDFFRSSPDCEDTIIFAYRRGIIVGSFKGNGLGARTGDTVLGALHTNLRAEHSVATRITAQLCKSGDSSDRILGVSINTSGDIAFVQKRVQDWRAGRCIFEDDLQQSRTSHTIEINRAESDGANIVQEMSSNAVPLNGTTINRIASEKSTTCRYIQVEAGDGCAKLVTRCSISVNDFYKFNPKANLCSTLFPGDYICCSSGDAYSPPPKPKPATPKPNSDGICATHLIQAGDTCDDLSKKYGVTVAELENWNKGKTWAWSECKDLLVGYNLCISDGDVALPPPQKGSACGPVVPGTKRPSGKSVDLTKLNPCPLKACCSNWGFCGVFPDHCEIHSLPGGGPGSKPKNKQNTCVSNCGSDIKENSGPPTTFQRIGYYESYNLDRQCLWLQAKNANTDGTYTHIHWGFAGINPNTYGVIINDTHQQWSDFKSLPDVKRILSFGGWAYSTEPATFNIIRQAIIRNGDTFVKNLAQFVKDEGIDGIDMDWEYPGAPDIMVNGKPIGEQGDGFAYLSFLSKLKEALGPDKSVSIAAPASYWYLKAFPIKAISETIDYIVYMTYDLHGQWDYGNKNSFEACDSGKCVRSHVNLTETRNALSMITKAGVPNNKIFVGESSYGRSFHLAKSSCWGPLCDFTGSRERSDANPGRCTNTGGYIAYAEIVEILKGGDGVLSFHDTGSNSDVLVYKGDYVSYMTPTTKDTRREDWRKLNFAGTIDWAVDLQSFGSDDSNNALDRPRSGNGCRSGRDDTIDTGDLCEFSCHFGFCPETLCTCRSTGRIRDLPPEKNVDNVIAWNDADVDTNRLCKFACKYGFCPDDVCTIIEIPEPEPAVFDEDYAYNSTEIRRRNWERCIVYKDPQYRDLSVQQCKEVCKPEVDAAIAEGRTTNYGCIGFYPLEKAIPWTEFQASRYGLVANGQCVCDNWLMNEIVDTFIEALPAISQIGCYILMSSFKFVLDLGANFIPGAGKALDAGLDIDMMTVAAQLAKHAYPEEEDPEGAFSWWLKPCGGTSLVPDDIKRVFDILGAVGSGVSSLKKTKVKKGSGKKGDKGNPKESDRTKPKEREDDCARAPSKGNSISKDLNVMMPCVRKTKPKCRIPPGKASQRVGPAKNTFRVRSCVNDLTITNEMIATSAAYAANAQPTQVVAHCKGTWGQACYHYSSAIRVNPQWATLTCPQEAATIKYRWTGVATKVWTEQHRGDGWIDEDLTSECDRDEYPPAYLLNSGSQAWINGGQNSKGQLIRFLPNKQNRGAGAMWKGVCLKAPLEGLSDSEFNNRASRAQNQHVLAAQPKLQKGQVVGELKQTQVEIIVNSRPEFTIGSWGQPVVAMDGLRDNPCWPSAKAAGDPGIALLTFDPFYGQMGGKPPYEYAAKYVKGKNGS
ncbi:glycoside hydrolase family 18 protein [Tothia fuscella]|uniref:chitinase n=1 Tax=Tothia fuscella TaxID=1048955 RepID=A0A9P4NHU7_9PEZI|nr:glycoside hydrolase family 18 protein [Tothia fuscella]